jgi:tetratricopeptide (TPR) repeat protein
MSSHVFVAMPYGTQEGVDFNRVYSQLIKPALENEGFEVFRADEELAAGNIRTDMFQELLLADLVVADLSIDNPNVWYELGVRHALRARGVILIQSQREKQPFDVYTDRKIRYHLKDGVPDPAFLEAEKRALARMARETLASWHGRRISPVYHHLRYLQEPDWKQLKVAEATEFWERFDLWKGRIEVARKRRRPGDILVLAEEAPVYALRTDAYLWAGKALMQMGHFSFALEQFEKALELEPDNLSICRLKGVVLGRLKRPYQAKELLERIVAKYPEDAETWALLGRVEKDAWIDAWRRVERTREQMFEDAGFEDAVLRKAIDAYTRGFRCNPTHYYSGINAVTLMHLLAHVADESKRPEEPDTMEGGLRWAIECALQKAPKSFWARVTAGELEVLNKDNAAVERTYKAAVAVAEGDWFALDSSRQQLLLLKDLRFHSPQVEIALHVVEHALSKLKGPWQPDRVFLFSGHMIDAPDRPEPRFPADKEAAAAKAIATRLDELDAREGDLALCGGACGGDLLFAEAALQRGMRLQIRIPFDIPTFFPQSVTFAAPEWGKRFYAVEENPRTYVFIMPEELGPLPKKANPYERNNRWQLYSALGWGPERVHFICLWNRQGGDGPGGTKHMHDEVEKRSGQVHVLDTNALW